MAEQHEKEPKDAEVAPSVQLDGPPWGEYADPDLAYVRGQIGAVGSGALGGWSCANNGGFMTSGGEDVKEVLAEVRRILAAKAEERARSHA
jgi:hypothetical protein